jgi:nucleolar GTP-binding protein
MKIPSVPRTGALLDAAARQTPGQATLAIEERFTDVVKGFPNFDELDPFVDAMAKAAAVDRDATKQALGRLHGSQRILRRMAHLQKREFLGRLKSFLARLEKPLETLHHTREVLRRIPDPTIGFTVCLAGYPNAGKSTLLNKLTGAKAQVANYAFTTKALNYGTMEIRFHPVQIVDTPGTLNRATANAIEKQALLALKHLAKAIVFVYDPLREADDQEQLFDTLFAYKVPVAIYAAKQDIVAAKPLFAQAQKRKLPIFTTPEEFTAWITPLAIPKREKD